MTKDLFSVGEIAIIAFSETHPEFVGRECTVVEIQQDGKCILDVQDGEPGYRYRCLPQQLRKKRPPREDLKVVRWDRCPWQPETINV